MTRQPEFNRLKEINHQLFSLTVWNDGTISILNQKDECAIATATFEEVYNLIKAAHK